MEELTDMEEIVQALKEHKTVIHKVNVAGVICIIQWSNSHEMFDIFDADGEYIKSSGCPILALMRATVTLNLDVTPTLWKVL